MFACNLISQNCYELCPNLQKSPRPSKSPGCAPESLIRPVKICNYSQVKRRKEDQNKICQFMNIFIISVSSFHFTSQYRTQSVQLFFLCLSLGFLNISMSILVGLIANLYYIVLGRFCLLTCMIIEKVALLLVFTDRYFWRFCYF